jgi:hypothetical protein
MQKKETDGPRSALNLENVRVVFLARALARSGYLDA